MSFVVTHHGRRPRPRREVALRSRAHAAAVLSSHSLSVNDGGMRASPSQARRGEVPRHCAYTARVKITAFAFTAPTCAGPGHAASCARAPAKAAHTSSRARAEDSHIGASLTPCFSARQCRGARWISDLGWGEPAFRSRHHTEELRRRTSTNSRRMASASRTATPATRCVHRAA